MLIINITNNNNPYIDINDNFIFINFIRPDKIKVTKEEIEKQINFFSTIKVLSTVV